MTTRSYIALAIGFCSYIAVASDNVWLRAACVLFLMSRAKRGMPVGSL